MPAWAAFAGFVGVVLAALLLLAFLSSDALGAPARSSADAPDPPARSSADVPDGPAQSSIDVFDAPARSSTEVPETLGDRVVGTPAASDHPSGGDRPITTATLFLNVVLSQGLFLSLLVLGAWVAAIPPDAFGLTPAAFSARSVGAGVALGGGLHAVNAIGSALSDRFGFADAGALRRALTPTTRTGWATLLLVVLPLVAGFEEFLFRGVLVGALAAGFDVSPWLLAALSSVAFALGHGAQGRIGVLVTGTIGFVLAAAFVLTGSLVTVVVAHYLVNALEFRAERS
jgi:membrane protease YdiL (CAAX protease family)